MRHLIERLEVLTEAKKKKRTEAQIKRELFGKDAKRGEYRADRGRAGPAEDRFRDKLRKLGWKPFKRDAGHSPDGSRMGWSSRWKHPDGYFVDISSHHGVVKDENSFSAYWRGIKE